MHDKWTEKELMILRKHFPDKSITELMKLLPNRCDSGIKNKARRLGFKKTE